MSYSYYDRIKGRRDAWKTAACSEGVCMVCGVGQVMLDCHEMIRRSQAPRSWGSTANYLGVCRDCHSTVVVNMPLINQLAFKLLRDPEHFDLAKISRIAGREIRLRDVVAAAKLLM